MTTSDYLKVQTEILIVIRMLRRLPLAEFMAFAEFLSEPPVDHQGYQVVSNPAHMAELAAMALQMVDLPARKPVASESLLNKEEKQA